MDAPYSDTNDGLHYDLTLDLDPRAGSLWVQGSCAYRAPLAGLERARFYLHRQFEIERVEGRRVLGYHFENNTPAGLPFAPQSGTLDVYFDPPLRKGQTALIEFAYSGNIPALPPESPNSVSPNWTELGLYLPWFPFQFDGAPASLSFTLKVRAPAGFQVASLGVREMSSGEWYFNWPHLTSDIVVAASPLLKLNVFTSQPNRVFVHTTTFGETAAAHLGEDLLWTLERYSGWFGPTRPADFTVIQSPRAPGSGYARRGLLVLAGLTERDYLEQREGHFLSMARETARAWWWEVPDDTWENWLNESFAEYSALLALRERFGEQAYRGSLERKRARTAGNAPLWEFDRARIAAPEQEEALSRVVYDQGPLLLHQLAEHIEPARFLALCRARIWAGVERTAHLLDLLEEIEGAAARNWFEDRLKNGEL